MGVATRAVVGTTRYPELRDESFSDTIDDLCNDMQAKGEWDRLGHIDALLQSYVDQRNEIARLSMELARK